MPVLNGCGCAFAGKDREVLHTECSYHEAERKALSLRLDSLKKLWFATAMNGYERLQETDRIMRSWGWSSVVERGNALEQFGHELIQLCPHGYNPQLARCSQCYPL